MSWKIELLNPLSCLENVLNSVQLFWERNFENRIKPPHAYQWRTRELFVTYLEIFLNATFLCVGSLVFLPRSV